MVFDYGLTLTDLNNRLKWFLEARFGMFIHWGLFSQVGRGASGSLRDEQTPIEEYEKLAETWKPLPNTAHIWAKLAKKAGMRYMVLTAKHAEGFCLWDSKLTDYTAPKHGPGRDLVSEFVNAARDMDIRVGIYYPLTDMHHPDGILCQKDLSARRRFVDYNHGQLRELMTNYGKIDLLWYDCCWPLYDEHMENVKMNKMVRELQPEILINDRSGLKEDFGTPEGHISPADGGRPWEACMTFNNYWSYSPIDTEYKTSWHIVKMLREVAAGGGNLLLNIGPKPNGTVPEPCVNALLETGIWLKNYGTSIYDATDPVGAVYLFTGSFTRKGNILYFHCNRWPGSELAIGGMRNKVLEVHYLNSRKIKFKQSGYRLVLYDLPKKAPSQIDTVFAIRVEGIPNVGLPPPYNCVRDDAECWSQYWKRKEILE
jgi:alpha-L-fucosidase